MDLIHCNIPFSPWHTFLVALLYALVVYLMGIADSILCNLQLTFSSVPAFFSVSRLQLYISTSSLHLLLRAFSIAPFGHDTEQICCTRALALGAQLAPAPAPGACHLRRRGALPVCGPCSEVCSVSCPNGAMEKARKSRCRDEVEI